MIAIYVSSQFPKTTSGKPAVNTANIAAKPYAIYVVKTSEYSAKTTPK